MPEKPPSAVWTLVALAAGLGCGALAQRWAGARLEFAIDWLEVFGAIWLGALRVLVLPLMVSVLFVAIGRADSRRGDRVALASLGWFLAFLVVGAVATVLAANFVLQAAPAGADARAAFQAAAAGLGASAAPPAAPARDWFVHLVPTNLVAAAARDEVLPTIVATLLFAVALRYAPTPSRERLLELAQAVADACLALARLLFRVLPAAVFVLALASAVRSGTEMAWALLYYVVLLVAFLAAAIALLYPATAWLARLSMARLARAAWPVQLLAFSTRSSIACFPAMLVAVQRDLGVSAATSSITLPLAVSSFKLNMAVSANFQLLFLLHLYGLDPEPMAWLTAVAALTLQSFVTPGLPSGAVWTTTPLYLALGIPLEGIVLTNVVDTIPDLFKTTLNVTGSMSVAAVVGRARQ